MVRYTKSSAQCSIFLIILFLILGGIMALVPIDSWAQFGQPGPEPATQAEVQDLKKEVQELKERIGKFKPASDQKAAEPRAFEAPVGPIGVSPTASDWLQKVRIYGDMGVRAEFQHNVAHLTGEDTYRTRYRLRIFGYVQPNPYWEAGFRISNGDPRYPSTGWETFGQTQSPGEVSGPEAGSGRSGFVTFDRMFVNWTPNRYVKIQTGKQELPFWKPWMVWGSSVWHDDDVQPAGFAEKFNLPSFGPFKNMRLTLGQFALGQASSSRSGISGFQVNGLGSSLWGQQISGMVSPRQDLDVAFGVGFFVFDNLNGFAKGIPAAMTAGVYRNRNTNQMFSSTPGGPGGPFGCTPFAGTSAVTAARPVCDRFLSDYRILNTGIEFNFKTKIPVRFAIDTAYNFGAARRRPDADKLAFAGLTHVSVGSFREPGEMQFGAGYYWGQADATWAVYADDDYLNTNVNTIMFNWKWKMFREVTLVWDNYIRRWNDSQLAVEQGIVPGDGSGNATFTSSRLTWVVTF